MVPLLSPQMVSVTAAVNCSASLFGDRMGLTPAELRTFNLAVDALGVPDPKRGNTKFVETVRRIKYCLTRV